MTKQILKDILQESGSTDAAVSMLKSKLDERMQEERILVAKSKFE